MITAKQMTVTPKQAADWLKENKVNRRVRGWWVNALSSMIKRGEWIVTHQGVAFTKDGTLIDGQHRLLAIEDSGIPVDMMVFNDVPKEAYSVLDAGVKRTVSDLTGLEKKCAEVARMATKLIAPSSTGIFSAQYISQVAGCGISELHDKLSQQRPTNVKFYSSAPMRLAALVLVMDGRNDKYVFDVYSNLVHQKFDDLPVIAKSLIRQVSNNTVRATDSFETMSRALKVFSPDYRDAVQLKLSDSEKTSSIVYARSVITKALDSEAKMAA